MKKSNIVDGITYIVEESFIHYNTKTRMHRVKRIFQSGGLDFCVYTDEQLERITGITM